MSFHYRTVREAKQLIRDLRKLQARYDDLFAAIHLLGRVSTMTDQYYLFTMPGDELIWAETYLADGTHVVAPTPYTDTQVALDYLSGRYPDATVDELCDAQDLAEVRAWARTRPLEQIS